MSRTTPLILVGLSVLLLGALVLVDPQTPDDSRSADASTNDASADELAELERKLAAREQRIADLEQQLRAARPREQPGTGSAPAQPTRSGDVPNSSDYDFVQRSIAERAAILRSRGRTTIDQAGNRAARRLARELIAAREAALDASRGGSMAWLASPGGAYGNPAELTASAKLMAKFTRRHTDGPTVDGTAVVPTTPLADGTTLTFGAGNHALNVGALNARNPFPQDLLIVGQGMNETVVRMSRELAMRGDVHSLTFRDLTIDTWGKYLERMRQHPFTLRMERCRVIGFDIGAGQSTMLGGSTAAFYAQECRFEGGFGPSPGSGQLFSVGRMLAARLEDCVIVGPVDPFGSVSSGAVHFTRCEFVNVDQRVQLTVESSKPRRGLRFEDCTVTLPLVPSKLTKQLRRRRSLGELNPLWGK